MQYIIIVLYKYKHSPLIISIIHLKHLEINLPRQHKSDKRASPSMILVL